jgi:hypothetical protein
MRIPVRHLVSALLLCAALPCAVRAQESTADAPIVFGCDGKDLAASKSRWAAGDPAMKRIVDGIVADADKALTMAPPSVMQKAFTPPTGDKHDYTSLSPYWWPDPAKPDGLPYLRKDGQFNPDRSKFDVDKLDAMTSAVQSLGYAYYFTGDEKYAGKAKELIKVWFFDDATRMNPNLRFAQTRPGHPETQASGVIEGNRLRYVIDADGLLATSKSWTNDDSTLLKGWFKELLTYLLNSEQGKKEQKSPNNHGTFYGVQTATYALYIGDNDLARKLLTDYVQARIATQVEADGSQPLELERTRGFDYSRFNLLAHEDGAVLGERVGLDLWNYTSPNGRSLRLALDWLAPYATGDKAWEHQQISPSKLKEAATVYRRAANAYGQAKYERVADAALRRAGLDGAPGWMELCFPRRDTPPAPGNGDRQKH